MQAHTAMAAALFRPWSPPSPPASQGPAVSVLRPVPPWQPRHIDVILEVVDVVHLRQRRHCLLPIIQPRPPHNVIDIRVLIEVSVALARDDNDVARLADRHDGLDGGVAVLDDVPLLLALPLEQVLLQRLRIIWAESCRHARSIIDLQAPCLQARADRSCTSTGALLALRDVHTGLISQGAGQQACVDSCAAEGRSAEPRGIRC